MSREDRRCEEELCFAHSIKNTCVCLANSYESSDKCPFFKTPKELSEQKAAIKKRLKDIR